MAWPEAHIGMLRSAW